MMKAIVVLMTGLVTAFCWALCIIYCADNVFPFLMTMSGVHEGDTMWPAVLALEAFITLVLLIPWIMAAYAFIQLFLRIVNYEREVYPV
jgi:hypothetical protein